MRDAPVNCLAGVTLLLACCVSVSAADERPAAPPNNLFTAAGFAVKYATTPEKREILASLPRDKLVKRTRDGTLYYVYADPVRCNCAYVGTPQAYAVYQSGGNSAVFGGGDDNTVMQAVDTDIGGSYVSADLIPNVDSILDPEF